MTRARGASRFGPWNSDVLWCLVFLSVFGAWCLVWCLVFGVFFRCASRRTGCAPKDTVFMPAGFVVCSPVQQRQLTVTRNIVMKSARLFLLWVAFALANGTALRAQVPQLINFQGRVAADGVNFNGTGQFKFALVNGEGTGTFWSNDGTVAGGTEPVAAVPIPVSQGLYSVLLGDATLTNMLPISAAIFTNGDVRLRIWFNDGTNGFEQLTPDQRIAAVGYAMMAPHDQDG